MKTKISFNWNIEIDVETVGCENTETVMDLMLKSSNLMNAFGDALKNMDFRSNLNEMVNNDFKVTAIYPKCAKKYIKIES